MAKFNTGSHRVQPAVATASSPIRTSGGVPNTCTYEGAPAWTKDPRTDLFIRLTSSFHGGEKSFYESAEKRDDTLRQLVRQLAVEDPDWVFEFATWLRGPGNIRTAALMVAVEFVKARLDALKGGTLKTYSALPSVSHHNRRIIDSVCQRADEPGVLLAYWTHRYGRSVPKALKRGLADAVRRLYNERSLLKHDTGSHAYRFGDVLELCHPSPDPDKAAWQGDLFKYALDRRHGRGDDVPASLNIIAHNDRLRERVTAGAVSHLLEPVILKDAGMTWEDALSLAGDKVDKAKLWEAMIPNMGYMALLRNLRNFDQAGVGDTVAEQVIARLKDPEQVAKSRQFPFRFLAAYRAASASLRWAYPLEQALNLSLGNVPSLGGRTLILVDRSPSMFPGYLYSTTNRSDISLADQAAVFGAALALRAQNPTLVEFGGDSRVITVSKGASVLRLVEMFGQINATDIPSAIKKHYDGHDRVIVVTDEQTRPGYFPSNMYRYGGMTETPIDDLVPQHVPVFMWALGGYTSSALSTGENGRFTLGGLTDKAFLMIPQLEAGLNGTWPWETTQAP